MRAGAREFVLESDHEELRLAVRTHAKVTFGAGDIGQVITIFGAKGGVGATAIATNLAGAMQRRSLRVCLVDLDLYLGDVLAFLDIPGSYSITDVLANMSRLDRELLATSVTKHRSGVSVLAQSSKVEEAEQIKGPDVTALLEFLRRNYDFVIVDGVRGFDELSLAALDGSQHVFMTLTQDVPAVRNGQRCLELFGRLQYDQGRDQALAQPLRQGLQDHRRGRRGDAGAAAHPHHQQRLPAAHRRHQPRGPADRGGAARADHARHRRAHPASPAGEGAAPAPPELARNVVRKEGRRWDYVIA